jgi:hypothetical protein
MGPVASFMRAPVRAAPLLAAAVVMLGACAQPPKPLYLWETFPRQQYEALLGEGGSAEDRVRAMETHAEKARATNAALPPGFRAHLGMLHLALGNLDAARQMWEAEKLAFPESRPYMDRLLGKLPGSDRATPRENPS